MDSGGGQGARLLGRSSFLTACTVAICLWTDLRDLTCHPCTDAAAGLAFARRRLQRFVSSCLIPWRHGRFASSDGPAATRWCIRLKEGVRPNFRVRPGCNTTRCLYVHTTMGQAATKAAAQETRLAYYVRTRRRNAQRQTNATPTGWEQQQTSCALWAAARSAGGVGAAGQQEVSLRAEEQRSVDWPLEGVRRS
jgi:hypothetical protein